MASSIIRALVISLIFPSFLFWSHHQCMSAASPFFVILRLTHSHWVPSIPPMFTKFMNFHFIHFFHLSRLKIYDMLFLSFDEKG